MEQSICSYSYIHLHIHIYIYMYIYIYIWICTNTLLHCGMNLNADALLVNMWREWMTWNEWNDMEWTNDRMMTMMSNEWWMTTVMMMTMMVMEVVVVIMRVMVMLMVDLERPGGREWLPSGTPLQNFTLFWKGFRTRACTHYMYKLTQERLFWQRKKKWAPKILWSTRDGASSGTRFCMYCTAGKKLKKIKFC